MRKIVVTCLLAAAGCGPHADQAILQGSWTWEGADCAQRRYEFTNDSIRAVLPDENVMMYRILKTSVGGEQPPEVVLDLQLLPQPGMSADILRFLKETGGVHSMSFKVERDRIRPLTLSMNGNSAPIRPGGPVFHEFSLHRCKAGADG